jgi:hypothetical protein
MRCLSSVRVSVLALTLGAAACSEPGPTISLPIYDMATPALGVVANDGRNAGVPLSGAEEVPARPTKARGTAVIHFSDDGTELSYKLIVANIDNVVQSHIHIGAAGTNGPIVVFLYGLVPSGGGRQDGVIAEGTLTAANLIGPLAGQSMDVLKGHILSGNAYVNVHTNDGVAPINTGPGDFPGGEVRGQIE